MTGMTSPRRMPMVSWLERKLLEERQALESALAVKHEALLKEIGPYLQGVEWTASYPEDPPGGKRDGPQTDVPDNSQATPLSVIMGEAETSTRIWSTDECTSEDIVVSGELPASQPCSDGIGTEPNKGDESQGPRRSRRLSKWAGREDESSKQLKQLQVIETVVANTDAETFNGIFARLRQFVTGQTFELGFAMMIFLNTVVMALEAQHKGLENAWKVGYPGTTSPASEIWPGVTDFFLVAEWIFGILFTMELLLKLVVLQNHFCSDIWNFIDSVIVIGWIVTVIALFPLPIHPMLLRLVRLARLLRLLRLIRKIRLLDSLYLMYTAMRGSMTVLLWSVIVLALVQMLLALFLQSLLEVYILDEEKPEAARLQVFKFYGTFARSMLTLFEMTLGNWMPPCRALVENVSEWWMLFSLAHKLVIGFSVVSVITSVFIQETFKVAAIDDKIMIMSTERARKMHIRKINALFGYTDHDGNGFLDVGEFTTVLQDSGIRTWLASMGLQVRDIPQFFELLDVDGNGRLTVKELVEGISVLKGTATSYDMKIVENCNLKLKEDLQIVQTQLKRIGDRCQAVQSAEPTIMQAV